MMRLAKENNLKKPIVYKNSYHNETKSTRYDMFIRCQTRGRILMIALFFPDLMAKGVKEPTYEIYINRESNEWITRMCPHGQNYKWSTAKLENLGRVNADTYIGETYYMNEKDTDSRIWQSEEGKTSIKNLLGVESRGWKGILEWQKEERKRQIREKEERQQKPWDEDMKLIPPVLNGFVRWSKHDATDQNYIFYDYDPKGAKTGYCSYCEKIVPIKNPKRNKVDKCPCCGKQIEFKVANQIQTLSRDEYYTEYIQKFKGGFVIRRFELHCWYRDRKPDNPHWYMKETDRYMIFDNGKTKRYSWEYYKNKKMRWVLLNEPYFQTDWGHSVNLYTKNLSSLKKTVLKNSAIELWDKLPCCTAKYIWIERHNPAIEMLAKIGMFTLAEGILKERYDKDLLKQNETEIAKILKVDKARLKRLKSMNGNVGMLKWMQFEKVADTIWPDEMIHDLGDADIKPSDLQFISPHPHFVKCWNYIKKQTMSSEDNIKQSLITWSDYYNMAEKAKWNTKAEQIAYPKNLEEAHADVIMYLQGTSMKNTAEKLEKKWPKVNEILPDIKKFEWNDDDYVIVTPNNILDIVKEGTALSHCVHTCDFYFDRIQKNESYLFFLRKKSSPDRPWYTLEVEPSGNIRQKRTTGDNQNKDFDKAIPFLKKWQQVFKSRLTKEEIELGILANKARIKEYKKLRKDGNKIWHGKLAGQLLADVLESDFMEAM